MADCSPHALPPVEEDAAESAEQRNQCDQMVPTEDENRSSSGPSVISVSSTGSRRIVGIVEKNLEATAKLRQMREHKEKHRKKLRENLPPLDEHRVKR